MAPPSNHNPQSPNIRCSGRRSESAREPVPSSRRGARRSGGGPQTHRQERGREATSRRSVPGPLSAERDRSGGRKTVPRSPPRANPRSTNASTEWEHHVPQTTATTKWCLESGEALTHRRGRGHAARQGHESRTGNRILQATPRHESRKGTGYYKFTLAGGRRRWVTRPHRESRGRRRPVQGAGHLAAPPASANLPPHRRVNGPEYLAVKEEK